MKTTTIVSGLVAVGWAFVLSAEPLVINKAQTAVLDPADWDKVIAGELYFDATRPLLIRFPEMAEAVHKRLAAGEQVVRLELVLEWERQEGAGPQRGRSGWGADEQYAADPGEWHVVGHALLKPWGVGGDVGGPTFNAHIGGVGFWARGGAAADGIDRCGITVGPLPLYQHRGKKGEAPPCATGLLLKGFKAVPQVYLNRVEVKAEAAGDATWRIVF